MKRTIFLIVLSTLLLSGVAYLVGDTHALDAPHDTSDDTNKVNCSHCHYPYGTTPDWLTQPVVEDNTALNNLCKSCHIPMYGMSDPKFENVQTHSSYKTSSKYDTWVMECVTCHNPHYQRQVSAYRGQGNIETGTSTAMTTTTLTDTTKTWAVDAFAYHALIPNSNFPTLMYRIVSNTADTITVQGSMLVPDYANTGDAYGIRYPNMVNDLVDGGIGPKAVKLFDNTGANSFADGEPNVGGVDTVVDGVCQVCHTQTHSYKTDGTLETAAHPSGNVGTNCTSCHVHHDGFAASGCDVCHGNPPTTADIGTSTGLATPETGATNPASPGAHATHVTTRGMGCEVCHAGNTMPTVSDTIQMGFVVNSTSYTNWGPVAVTTGTFEGYNNLNAGTNTQYTWEASSVGTTVNTVANYDNTCSNLYCHGSTLTGGNNTAPSWVGGPAEAMQNCTTNGKCHGSTNTLPPTAVNHPRHAGSAAGGLALACATCHPSVTDGGHVTGTVSWALDTANNRVGSSAKYRTAASGNTGALAPSTPYGSCETVYCHSNVQTADGTNPADTFGSPQWGSGVLTCGTTSCHGDPPASGKHATHLNNTIHAAYDCSNCHLDKGDETADHADYQIDVAMSTFSNGAYGDPTGAPANGYTTCSSLYCHSTIQSDNVSPGGDGPPTFNTPDWGAATFNCTTNCHNASSANGSHPRHLNNTVHASYNCVNCHDGAENGNNTLHVNKQINVSLSTFSGGSYNDPTGAPVNGYTTCGTVYCHSTVQDNGGINPPASFATPQWGGGTLVCGSCHSATPGTGSHTPHLSLYTCTDCHKDAGFETTNHASKNIDIDLTNHGAPAAYSQSPNPPQNGYGSCSSTNCHGTVSDNWGTALTSLDHCTICHGLKTTGADQSAAEYLRSPGADGIGVDTGGNSNPADERVGAHQAHLLGQSNYSAPIACTECHVVPTNVTQNGHIDSQLPADITYGTLAKTNNPPATSCGTIYCHNSAYFKNGWTPAGTAPVWNDTSYLVGTSADCAKCHGYPPGGGHPPSATNCVSCHDHVNGTNDGFTPAGKALHVNGIVEPTVGGECLTCHAQRQGTPPDERFQIVGGTAGSEGDDFIRASRHVSDGTTNAIVTNFDCIVCHAEGDNTSSGTTIGTTSAHFDGFVSLRNVDSAANPGTAGTDYWQWPGWRNPLVSWTATTQQRDDMDTFCMSCHDSDTSSATAGQGGAYGIAVNASAPADGLLVGAGVARRLSPFNTDDNRLNAREVDTDIRNARLNMNVVDVRGQFNYQNLAGKNWASHHNLNQFTKRYTTRNTTAWPDAAWTTYTTKEGQNIRTAGETAGLHCSDCHLNEANAHGTRNTYYMLSDSAGNDEAFLNGGNILSTGNCSKCHAPTTYGMNNTSTASRTTAHNQDGARCNRWDNNNNTGVASLGSYTEILAQEGTTALPCLACHAGIEFGMIHGTNSTYNPGQSGTWTSPRYRFMGAGGSMRWYTASSTTSGTDASWEDTSATGCYTISNPDTWGGCDRHNSINSSVSSNRSRPLEY